MGILNKIKGKFRWKQFLKKYQGTSGICNFCGFENNGFLVSGYEFPVLKEKNVVGAGKRPNNCPLCYSSDRSRLIWAYLNEKENLDTSLKILHVAPEKVIREKFLKMSLANYTCIDLKTEGYNYPEGVLDMDLCNTAFDSESFDLIICNHVLEHIPDDKKAMNEIFRILTTGGKAILQVPIALSLKKTYENTDIKTKEERENHFGQYDHVRLYGIDYKEKLESCGFSVDLVNISEEHPKLGLNPNENIYICYKK